MRGIMTLLAANYKKRAAQSLLTLIIIITASVMFTTALSVATSLDKPFESMFQALDASHIQVASQYGIYDNEVIKDWWERQQGITVQTFKYHYSTDRLIYKGKSLAVPVFFTEKPDSVLKQDKLAILEGADKNCPGKNEIWVCKSFADKNHVAVSDELYVSTKDGLVPMKVSAIIADFQFGSPSMGVIRIWTAPGTLESLFDNKNTSGDFIGLKFDDYSRKQALWDAFEKDLGQTFATNIFNYELISEAYLMQYQIMGAILVMFSFVLLFIAVCIIAFTISAAVAADVKNIGILKSQGYTPQAMTGLYALQYCLLSVIAVPIGILISTYVVRTVTDVLTASMGITSIELPLLLPGLIAFIVIVSFVSLISFLMARRAGRLKPVAAIREEMTEAKETKFISFQKTSLLPLPILMAFRQILTEKWQSLLILIGSVALAGVFTFSVNIFNTFDHIFDRANSWGYDRRSDTLSFKEGADRDFREKFIEELRKDERIEASAAVSDNAWTARVGDKASKNERDVTVALYEGDASKIGALCLEGRNPERENEISITNNIKKKYHKNVGDYITIDIAGKKLDLLVCGVYQTTSRMGWGLRAQASILNEIAPDYQFQSYAVIFKNSAQRESFIKEIEEKYPGKIDIQPFEDTLESFMFGVKSGINSFIILLGGIFTLVMTIIIFNSTLVSIYREKRVYGVMKSIGMTPVQARMTIVWRTWILTITGVLIGVPLSYFTEVNFMNLMLSSMGMVEFPIVASVPGMSAVIPACLMIGFISSWIPSKKIHNISPRNLIIE